VGKIKKMKSRKIGKKPKAWYGEMGKLNRDRAMHVKNYLKDLKIKRYHFDYFENKKEKLYHLCLNCGDHLGNICQTHHINPYENGHQKNKIRLCGSCHQITYAALNRNESNKQLKKRGKLFQKNLKGEY